jgi:hypothetical protein
MASPALVFQRVWWMHLFGVFSSAFLISMRRSGCASGATAETADEECACAVVESAPRQAEGKQFDLQTRIGAI